MIDVTAAQAGDPNAFAAIMHQYRRLFYKIARQYLDNPDDMDDAVQVTMIKVWRYLPGYSDGNLKAWLGAIARNTCKDMIRRSYKHRCVVSYDTIAGEESKSVRSGDEDDPEWLAMQAEAVSELVATMDVLKAEGRHSLYMVAVREYTYEEAATLQGVALGTVKSRVWREREKVKGAMPI